MSRKTRFVYLSLGIVSMALLTQCAVNTPAPQTAARQFTRMASCPDSPNCVSTLAPPDDSVHAIAPIPFSGSAEAAKAQLLEIVAAMPRTQIIEDEGDYLHVEYRSQIFRFVDDVEFQIDDSAKLIQFRSAARVGYGDMGVNRKRMEEVRTRFAEFK